MVFLRASFVLLATSLIALSIPLEQRSFSDLTADFSAISASLASVQTDLDNLANVGPDGLTPLENDRTTLVSDIQKATSDVISTGLLDETDSQNLLDQSVGPVGETLVNVLQTFVKEEPTFEQFNTEVPGLVEGVEEALEELAQTTQDLITALNDNNPPDVVSEAAPARTAVANAFADAIAAFSD